MEGRDLIASDIQWQMSNGAHINIWEENWIPGLGKIERNNMDALPQTALRKVVEILNEDEKSWNLEGIRSLITDKSAEAIEMIPLGDQSKDDRLIWSHNVDGKYSVKSGYHTAKEHEVRQVKSGSSSSHMVSETLWKLIWQTPGPRKGINIMVKAKSATIAEALAVREGLNLAKDYGVQKLIIETDCQKVYQRQMLGDRTIVSGYQEDAQRIPT
ncbi:putative ribonuclease H protein [Corchorus olitorius]|uniref:Ribonuclease H protein n=1 Tax=Corchorus olitorius TaxID=93759 RepID=A0A1R3KF59_9ROSI|nr:putative ribonuclease H protein [Corchorus olitorius]